MDSGPGRRTAIVRELSISVLSGAILTVGAKLLSEASIPFFAGRAPIWLLIGVGLTAGLLAFFLGRRLSRGPAQVFVLISAFTTTQWLATLLDHLARTFDRLHIDLVVKLPGHDHSGQSQLLGLGELRRKRRSYVGGLVVSSRPEQVGAELREFSEAIGRPVVFLDVRPFADPALYPPGSAFVGCRPDEIGEVAADWLTCELSELGREKPHVFVVGGDAQAGRHERFAVKLRESLPGATIETNLQGLFRRDRAAEIVRQHLRRASRRGTPVDAIFCTNDEMALGAADAVQFCDEAIRPVIVGVDGSENVLAAIRSDSSSLRATVVQDARHLAEVAVDLLLRMSRGETVAAETYVPVTLYAVP